jgi:hypothetical protein
MALAWIRGEGAPHAAIARAYLGPPYAHSTQHLGC